ncbi:RNA polymerase sigma factor [Flavobacterium frigidarium]|uniref:RNA polymerase sigma factor n=1 Tax=Flavobacterium frigidarium TaxID=99286 RepID=A0ABV4KEH8_9FLAO|nr:RNA polymerase sigma factor [Flavobacterium frigidarium]MBU2060606.1 RNA polymerase sigma factor [Bacteroidota bacterium]
MILDQLIEECKKHNPKAQEQLYHLFSKKFFGLCLKYSSNYADAQDNLQDGFILLFKKIEQFSGKGSFEGWAKRVMINNALQKFKGVRFMEVLSDEIPDEIVTIEEDNVPLDYLMKIIQELPEQYRIVFNLYVLDGYSHKEISEMLHLSTGTTKSNLHRARLILKEKLEHRIETNIASSAE